MHVPCHATTFDHSVKQILKIMAFLRFIFLLVLLNTSITYCQENHTPHIWKGPLVITYKENNEHQCFDEDLQLHCTSWRFAVEANNLGPWKTIPKECHHHVKDYILGKGYKFDIERVSKEAGAFAASHELSADGRDIWVFDVDETLLSNLPLYYEHSFGLEHLDSRDFYKWVEKGTAPAIQASLELYQEVFKLGYRIFLLTGRNNKHRDITIENLVCAGFHHWEKLIMRNPEDRAKLATIFKSEKRNEMVEEGYRIVGNSGDQWSDLFGSSMSIRSFKLPNPIYYIP
ncbi:phosphatase [Lithospermum erythrorhizon]|uniref:Phosphatase n=1 Tax=Lithospermum erythrorhizon TaxID=34254 RepID=A0AAV3RW88_LITER